MAEEQEAKGRGRAWPVVLAVFVVVGAIWAFSAVSGDDEPPGSPAVYDDIEATTSCPDLQSTFDDNMGDAERRGPNDPLYDTLLGYATAANDRMVDLGC